MFWNKKKGLSLYGADLYHYERLLKGRRRATTQLSQLFCIVFPQSCKRFARNIPKPAIFFASFLPNFLIYDKAAVKVYRHIPKLIKDYIRGWNGIAPREKLRQTINLQWSLSLQRNSRSFWNTLFEMKKTKRTTVSPILPNAQWGKDFFFFSYKIKLDSHVRPVLVCEVN